MADISIIVTAHNLSAYIEACLASVATPTTLAVEIIVVDDVSTDDTVDKIQAFAQARPDCNLTLLHTEGDVPRGPGHARNLGIERASADKIAFVDGDDWIDLPAYVNLVTLMRRHRAELGWLRSLVYHERRAEFWPFYDEGIRRDVLAGRTFTLTNVATHPQLGGMEPQCCNRIYDSALLRADIGPFPEDIIYEDLPFHYRAVFSAERILLSGETGYFYRTQRVGKITDRNDAARFDLARAMAIQNDGVFAQHADAAAGVHVVQFLAQLALWCVMAVPVGMRSALTAELSVQFARLPAPWVASALEPTRLPDERAFMLWLFLCAQTSGLQRLHSSRWEPQDYEDFEIKTGRRVAPMPVEDSLDVMAELEVAEPELEPPAVNEVIVEVSSTPRPWHRRLRRLLGTVAQ